jgi:aryl-alcohol dehydrogenase-like predicted oxidoreductase
MSTLFLGAMTFADSFAHGAGLAEARRIIDAYADAGGNVVDTAVNYRGGASEEILGDRLARPQPVRRPADALACSAGRPSAS